MIDASTFANSFNAFWNAYAPTCEHFVRRLNLDGVERYQTPMTVAKHSGRRALVAELSFSIFAEKVTSVSNGANGKAVRSIENAAWLAAKKRLLPYARQGLDLTRKLNKAERSEVNELSSRLERFFGAQKSAIVVRPNFNGCGFVDASEGDVISGKTVFEVKTVERPFRSNDIRQVVTYAALNFASKQFEITNIGLYNPRHGLYCDLELDYVCSEISGRPAQELLSLIVQTQSSGEMSR